MIVRERRSEPRAFAVAVTQSGRERPPSTTCLSVRTAARRVAHVTDALRLRHQIARGRSGRGSVVRASEPRPTGRARPSLTDSPSSVIPRTSRRCRPDTTLRAALSAMGAFRLLLFEQRLQSSKDRQRDRESHDARSFDPRQRSSTAFRAARGIPRGAMSVLRPVCAHNLPGVSAIGRRVSCANQSL